MTTMTLGRGALLLLLLVSLASSSPRAQVSADRLVRASDEPHNWLTYSGGYSSHRHSLLRQIDPANVKNIELKWVFQAQSLQKFEATPLVVNGIMYLTQAPNDVVALDARTGRVFWIYSHPVSPAARPCCGSVNRGVAILDDTLFMATLDAHLIAVDARSGGRLWNTTVADANLGYAMTMAPLVVKDKVLVGVAGGEFGIRGFVAAYDAKTGKELWRTYTIPGPGEPGHDTWQGDDWKTGGAPVWLTGSYDPDLNLVYFGTGNPGPDFNAAQRPGDNLYSDSAIALDADTGKLTWHFQFTPGDPYDYDAVQIPVLVDTNWNGRPRKLMMWANRNGFFYVLDRSSGEFLLGRPFVKVNWASGLDAKGRPIQTPQPPGSATYPGVTGGTNWYSPSYSPRTGLFYVAAWEEFGAIFIPERSEYKEGQRFGGGVSVSIVEGGEQPGLFRRSPVNNYTDKTAHGAIVAIDPMTGSRKWTFGMYDVTMSGVLSTASDLVFAGGREGYFHALDARTGAPLWKVQLGGDVASGPMSYQVDGKQYVAVAGGNGMFVFALRD